MGFGQWGKEKIFWTRDMPKRTGEEIGPEFQLHTQEGQDFSATAAESRHVDLTNNGMVNHYLRDVDHGSHCLAHHRTASFTYMSD